MRVAKLVKPVRQKNTKEDIDNLMLLSQIPTNAQAVLLEMVESNKDAEQMEFNTARLLWLNRKHIHHLGPGSGFDDDYYVHQTIGIMLNIGIPEERVGNLLNSGLSQAIIAQRL